MGIKSRFVLFAIAALSGFATACEPECRQSIARAFAERYIPVVQRSVNDLNDLLYENLYNVPIPEKLLEVVPERVLREGVQNNLEDGLDAFMEQVNVTDGIYLALFSGDEPFKGDCNNPPRLDRKKPNPGESWTLEECEKMDYICGNPPSICHFLDTIKERIVEYLRTQLRQESAFGKGLLFQSVAPRLKQNLRATILKYGAGSLQKDPEVTSYINDLIFKMLSTLDLWLATDVENMCSRQNDYQLCEGWDDNIKEEILKWP